VINFGSFFLDERVFGFYGFAIAGEICLIFYSGLDYTGIQYPVKVFA
jgi:hypothetical protein